jgi:5-methylcytosine-specific restriction endonuclease McrA
MQGGGVSTTLLLSQSYEPIQVISWQRAFTLLTLGKIEVLHEYDDRNVRTTTLVFKMPAVVRLLQTFRRRSRPIKFSRVNIFARDKYRCQYCGVRRSISDLTYDHVVPRAQGGKTTWTNVVAACVDCNYRKGARTPEQAGMRLLTAPIQPRWIQVVTLRLSQRSVPDAWRDYLYWTSELLE